MSKTEFFHDNAVKITFLGLLMFCYIYNLVNAPKANNSSSESSEMFVNPGAVDNGTYIWDEKVFNYTVQCIDAGVSEHVHGALKILADQINGGEIPTKYLEMDNTRIVTPESIKLAWKSYWEKSNPNTVVCIAK